MPWDKNSFIISLFIISLFLIPEANAIYDFTGYTNVNLGNNDTGITLNYTAGDCRIRMGSYNTFSSAAPFVTNIIWYSPDGNSLGIAGPTVENTNCNYYGATTLKTINRNITNNLYESSLSFTQSATSGYITTFTNYICENPGDWITLNINNVKGDRNNNCIYRKRSAVVSTNYDMFIGWINELFNDYDNCGSTNLSLWASSPCKGSAIATEDYTNIQWIYPFNSSAGIINYSFSGANFTFVVNTGIAAFNAMILDFETNTYTTLYTEFNNNSLTGTFATRSGQISLEPDKIYLLVFNIYANSINYLGAAYPPITKLDIYTYHGDFLCGEWSECSEGTKLRTCVDQNGKAPDKIETTICYGIAESAILGFEEYTTRDDVYKCIPGWFLGCNYAVTNVTRDDPLGWTSPLEELYGGRFNYFGMSQEWATERTRSLKMWYIPPKPGEPDATTGYTTCINSTMGFIPYLNKSISNDTLSVGYNITFPSAYMAMSFDVKGCSGQVVQHDALNNWLLGKLCPGQCYGYNCSGLPKSDYQFWISHDGTKITGSNYFGSADNFIAKNVSFDLSGLGLIPGEQYNIYFAVSPENLNDQTGDCVMFDNVRYSVLTGPFEAGLPNDNCESGCIGSTYYLATTMLNGKCSVETIPFSGYCGHNESITKREPFCSGDHTIARYNSKIGGYYGQNCPYGCIDSLEPHCLAEGETDITIPPSTIDEYLNLTLYDIPFWASLLILAFTVALPIILVRCGAKDVGIMWPMPLFGIVQFIFVLSLKGILPSYFMVMIGVIAGAIIAFFISKTVKGV